MFVKVLRIELPNT